MNLILLEIIRYPSVFLYKVNVKFTLKSKGLEFKIVNKSNFKSKHYLQEVSAYWEMVQLVRNK